VLPVVEDKNESWNEPVNLKTMRKRFLVKLELKRKNVSVLLTFGQTIVAAMNAASAIFTTPMPALADISSALSDLETAIQNSGNEGGVLQTQILHDKRDIVENLLSAAASYVQEIANDPANNDNEIMIIESAGMQVKGFSPRQKQVFFAKAGLLPGEVDLVAASVARAFHEWQYTITPSNPESWVSLTSTTKARTSADGLTPLTVYSFRHRVVIKSGPQPWDNSFDCIVL
jgi:hypothetical protein